jgi:hypothetical protein
MPGRALGIQRKPTAGLRVLCASVVLPLKKKV